MVLFRQQERRKTISQKMHIGLTHLYKAGKESQSTVQQKNLHELLSCG